METKTCQACGETFERPTGHQRLTGNQWAARRFCSMKCAAHRERPWLRTGNYEPKVCANCGTTFERPTGADKVGNAQWDARRFCSQTCSHQGVHHWNWQGGRQLARGYVRVWIPADHPFASMRNGGGGQGRVLEHRLVLAEHLGRPLKATETVHHINGDKADNRLENLELRVGNHGVGASAAHCPTCTCFEH